MDQAQVLRTKILKLKYKIDKEQTLNASLAHRCALLRQLAARELTVDRALCHVNMLLREKGITVHDWVLSVDYPNQGNMRALLEALSKMKIQLERGERDLLLNFSEERCSEWVEGEEFEELVGRSGVKWE